MPAIIDEDSFRLPEVKEPYLPPLHPSQVKNTYTLVLDLDETLIHFIDLDSSRRKADNFGNSGNLSKRSRSSISSNGGSEFGGHFLIRPGAREFLQRMSKWYEVVIFTAAMQDYADWVLDQLDTGKWIEYRLYRQHAVREGPVFLKDLSKLGRDVSKMIIVDNVP